MSTIYLAQPIDQHIDDLDIGALASILQARLRMRGHNIYMPISAWSVSDLTDKRITDINNVALRRSDALIAILPKGARSIGVPYEIGQAQVMGLPYAVICDDPSGSAVLSGIAHVVAGTIEACESIEQQIRDNADVRRNRQIARYVGEHAPNTAYVGDAGYDLTYVGPDTYIMPGEFALLDVDLRVEMPSHMWCTIVGRSSTFKRGLMVNPAVIDAGFRGKLYAACINIGTEGCNVKKGERVAQLIPMPLLAEHIVWHKTERLSDSQRGENGFGSSGS